MFEGEYLTNALSPYSPTRRDPVLAFTATPNAGVAGTTTNVTLAWASDLGVSASIDQGVGAVGLNGQTIINGLTASRTWTFTVTKMNGQTVTKQVTYTAA